MYIFFTNSGTMYVVDNGRITRYVPNDSGHGSFYDPKDCPVLDWRGENPTILDKATFGWDVQPEEGGKAVFTVKGCSQAITTSRITRIVRR